MKRLALLLVLFVTACSGSSTDPTTTTPAPAAASSQSSGEASAPQEPAQAEATAPTDPGEKIYKQYCIVCHQADGSGTPPGGGRAIAGNFSGPGSVLAKSDKELLRSIKVGRSGEIGVMPKWMGIIDKKGRKAVLGYIRANFGTPPSSGASGQAPQGSTPEGS